MHDLNSYLRKEFSYGADWSRMWVEADRSSCVLAPISVCVLYPMLQITEESFAVHAVPIFYPGTLTLLGF